MNGRREVGGGERREQSATCVENWRRGHGRKEMTAGANWWHLDNEGYLTMWECGSRRVESGEWECWGVAGGNEVTKRG